MAGGTTREQRKRPAQLLYINFTEKREQMSRGRGTTRLHSYRGTSLIRNSAPLGEREGPRESKGGGREGELSLSLSPSPCLYLSLSLSMSLSLSLSLSPCPSLWLSLALGLEGTTHQARAKEAAVKGSEWNMNVSFACSLSPSLSLSLSLACSISVSVCLSLSIGEGERDHARTKESGRDHAPRESKGGGREGLSPPLSHSHPLESGRDQARAKEAAVKGSEWNMNAPSACLSLLPT